MPFVEVWIEFGISIVQKIESGEIRKNTIVHIISSRKVRDRLLLQYLVIHSAFYVTDMTVVKQMDYVIGNPLGGVGLCSMFEEQSANQQAQQQQPSAYQQPQPSYPPYQQQSSYQQNPPNTNMPLKNGPVGGNYQVDTTRFNQIPISAIHPYLDKNWYIRVEFNE